MVPETFPSIIKSRGHLGSVWETFLENVKTSFRKYFSSPNPSFLSKSYFCDLRVHRLEHSAPAGPRLRCSFFLDKRVCKILQNQNFQNPLDRILVLAIINESRMLTHSRNRFASFAPGPTSHRAQIVLYTILSRGRQRVNNQSDGNFV